MSPAVRPARWPWVALAVFFSLAIAGSIGVAANDESLAQQVPFIVAFTMFGVVGALVVSRAPGNRIGFLLLYGSCTSAIGYVAGEWMTYLWRTESPRERASSRSRTSTISDGSSASSRCCCCSRSCFPTATSRRRGGGCLRVAIVAVLAVLVVGWCSAPTS